MVGNALSIDFERVTFRYTRLSTFFFGLLVILFFGVLGIPVSFAQLKQRLRPWCVIDDDGVRINPWTMLPWSHIVTTGVLPAGRGDARAWVELTPDGAESVTARVQRTARSSSNSE